MDSSFNKHLFSLPPENELGKLLLLHYSVAISLQIDAYSNDQLCLERRAERIGDGINAPLFQQWVYKA